MGYPGVDVHPSGGVGVLWLSRLLFGGERSPDAWRTPWVRPKLVARVLAEAPNVAGSDHGVAGEDLGDRRAH
ncbi:MAG TPA: hypothetical protein VI094_12090 [Propionibacteriaceae bacterium]